MHVPFAMTFGNFFMSPVFGYLNSMSVVCVKYKKIIYRLLGLSHPSAKKSFRV